MRRVTSLIFKRYQLLGSDKALKATRRMSCVADKKKVPNRAWLTTSNGMDDLLEYGTKNCPLITLGNTYLAVRTTGDTSWGGAIPKVLDDKLRGRQNSLSHVSLVELGPDDTYYVQFEDGTSQWSAELDKYLWGFCKAGKLTIIAIGNDGNSFYAKNALGHFIKQNLPKGLNDTLVGRKNALPMVSNVNMGPNDEWFVRFEDGSWSCGGHTESCGQSIRAIKEASAHKIHEIQFGQDDNWMIRYFD